MNCEIQPLKNQNRDPGTLPPRGKVKEVKRDWIVHEDGALAYRLQDEEFRQHLHGNKARNMQIREDFPCAKEEQYREAEEAARLHQQWLQRQEEEDARVAAEIAQRLEREDHERKRRLAQKDAALAKHLQEKEREKRERIDLEVHTPRKQNLKGSTTGLLNNASCSSTNMLSLAESNTNSLQDTNGQSIRDNFAAINNIGLPVREDLVQKMRSCQIYGVPSTSRDERYSPSPPALSEDEARRLQEEQDAELARRLQEEEPDPLDPLTRDRLLAIETQDKELARLLWEKERARLRRAKERARARRRAAEMGSESEQPPSVETGTKPKPRYPDPDEIVTIPESSNTVDNIAMVIDPTYTRSHAQAQSENDHDSTVEGIALPYMPIQGQRRFNEKKPKSGKDGCKQQ